MLLRLAPSSTVFSRRALISSSTAFLLRLPPRIGGGFSSFHSSFACRLPSGASSLVLRLSCWSFKNLSRMTIIDLNRFSLLSAFIA
ncbi:hypothetical protein B0H14DRAFT_3854331 [Mycena olivaceomarginata]|nr:hypothetical protein B0H14DRAFT_3854331 [Mycena olivaceomarginata]